MPVLLDGLRSVISTPMRPLTSPILIYGAGAKGRQVAEFLSLRGYRLLGLADANAQAEGNRWGLPVKPLEMWLSEIRPADITLVVAIHNHKVPMAALLASLDAHQFSRIVNPIELHGIFAGSLPDHYWLTSPNFYTDCEKDLVFLETLFAEPASKELLCQIVRFRLSGDYGVLPQPHTADQYHPADLPRWHEPLRFVDCGAYDGDTIRHLATAGYTFSAIAAFEPDLGNFRRLSRTIGTFAPSVCLPCGVGSATAMERFDASGDMAGHFSEDSDTTIQCVSLDESLPGFRPTLIKMDIEGAELDALHGAKATIADARPGLAISLYHRPADLWQIPKLLASWDLGYTYHLRCHGYSSFDLVLYALPGHR